MNSFRYFSAHINTINTRPLTTLTTRTYLLKYSLISFYRSFQTSIKNNNNNNDNIEKDKIKNLKNNENDVIQKDEKINLYDKILSNDLNDTEKDVNLSSKELLSILKESLSQSRSIPISGENSQSLSVTSTSPSLSENSSVIPETSVLNSTSFSDSETSTPPIEETLTSTPENTFDPALGITNIIPSTEATEASTNLIIDKDDPRFIREDPIISQLINIIMRHGKKATARRFLADAMVEIRKQTHNDPYLITKTAIDKASPLVSHMSYKKGSKVTLIPKALNERQRRHKGIRWILDASDKRSGKNFSIRLANEILAVIGGNSVALKKKEQLHKLALANRANLPVKW
ncbi:ribosomal protein S7 domain-containing protein, partial [Glomus cerebriforme]